MIRYSLERKEQSMIECKACDGEGILHDDEGWKYECSVCFGHGNVNTAEKDRTVRVMEVDENNRLLD